MADEELRALERAMRTANTWTSYLSWARACERAGDPVPASLQRLLVRWDLRDRRAGRVILWTANRAGEVPRPNRLEDVRETCEGAATLAHDAVRRVLRELKRRGITTSIAMGLQGMPREVFTIFARYARDAARRKRERRDGRWRPGDRPRRPRGMFCAGCIHPSHDPDECEGLVLDSIAGARCECVSTEVRDDGWVPAESEFPIAPLPSWVRDGMNLIRRVAPAGDVDLPANGCMRCGHGLHDGVPCAEWVRSDDAVHPYHCPCPSLGPARPQHLSFSNGPGDAPEFSVFLPAGRSLTAEQEARLRQALLDGAVGHRTLVLDLPEGARVYRNGREVGGFSIGGRGTSPADQVPEGTPVVSRVPAISPEARAEIQTHLDEQCAEDLGDGTYRSTVIPLHPGIFPLGGTPVVHDGNAWAAGQTIALAAEAPRAPQNCPRCAGSATVTIGARMRGASYGWCSDCKVDVEFRADGTHRLLPETP